MSKKDPNYSGSAWEHFELWTKGEYDPSAGRLEINPPSRKPESSKKDLPKRTELMHMEHFELGLNQRIGRFHKAYRVVALLMALFLCLLLLATVSFLPVFGDATAPENNEVAQRYIEKGLEETGAVNIVAGMILDYRAFDTFGESCVLFVASCCVLILLRVDKGESPDAQALEDMYDRYYEPRRDTILQMVARLLVPVVLLFGIYVVLNGHISPGGGFSGGAIIGSGLILYLTAFGFERTGKFMTEKLVKVLTVSALTFYCFAKSYSFYTGANGLHSIITTGTPGAILSAGLIVYLNICVGIVVACTMYSFYVLFRKGGY